jgi:hypothetical protein
MFTARYDPSRFRFILAFKWLKKTELNQIEAPHGHIILQWKHFNEDSEWSFGLIYGDNAAKPPGVKSVQKFKLTDRQGCGPGYVKSGIATKEIKNPF